MRIMVAACLVFLMTACATQVKNPDQIPGVTAHLLPVDREGNFVPVPGLNSMDDVKNIDWFAGEARYKALLEGECNQVDPYPDHFNRMKEAMSDYFAAHTSDRPRKVVLFIHGGLNTASTSIGRAIDQYPAIMNDANGSSGIFPVFVTWRSGPVSSYGAHLYRVRQGEVSDTAPLTSPFYFLNDVGVALVSALTLKSYLVQGEHSYDSTIGREKEKEIAELEWMSENQPEIYYTGDGLEPAPLNRKAIWVLTSPAKIITTPVAHTMPRPAWDVMTRRSKALVYKPDDLAYPEPNKCGVPRKQLSGTGALPRFVRDLDRFLKEEANAQNWKEPVQLVLVGHSMGAIVSNHLLTAVPEVHFSDIVYMGAAASIRETEDATRHYMTEDRNSCTRFYSLSLFPENEDRERSVKGLMPSGSLLVWIDQMYTSPDTLFDRRVGRWTNVRYARDRFSPALEGRLHLKIFDNKGSVPREHGDFNDFPWWEESFWWGKPGAIQPSYRECMDKKKAVKSL